MVAARRVPIPPRVAEEKLPLPLLAWSSAPGARTTVSTRVSASSTRGADVEMDTHPSVDIEGYPVGEAGSMMVDGLPFHALLMNTGTDQGTLLIASQSDTKSSLNLDTGANTGTKLHVRGYYYGPVATGGSTYPTVWSEDIEAMSK
jgi:hypothetical protein